MPLLPHTAALNMRRSPFFVHFVHLVHRVIDHQFGHVDTRGGDRAVEFRLSVDLVDKPSLRRSKDLNGQKIPADDCRRALQEGFQFFVH